MIVHNITDAVALQGRTDCQGRTVRMRQHRAYLTSFSVQVFCPLCFVTSHFLSNNLGKQNALTIQLRRYEQYSGNAASWFRSV